MGLLRRIIQKVRSDVGYRMMSTKPMSPWLMLAPVDEGYKFYSLAEKKVLSINKSESESESTEFVGSSHGWIALFDRRTNDLFLSNPLTRRNIKLPQIGNLPEADMNARIGRRNVSKVILSSSPEDEGCRAMMTFGPANRLAFCSPSECVDSEIEHEWTPIGDLYTNSDMVDGETTGECAHVFEDLVYCNKRRVFNTITPCEFELDSFNDMSLSMSLLEEWDTWNVIGDWEVSSKPISVENVGNTTRYWVKKNKTLLQDHCVQIPHLVYAEEEELLYIALRFVMLTNPDDGTPVDRDASLCRFRGLGGYFSSKTVGFVILKLKEHADAEIVDDLNGLAIFVGINHSFALPASDFPELNPNSIYFTDSKRLKRIYARDDIGIFDYRNKTVMQVVSSDEIGLFGPTPPAPAHGLVMSSPMWFNPDTING
ncbi:hypothetical protein OROMI_030234 [Orobanche minor]